ncbi:MAG: metallophosphoesterase family protein [Saccharofermentanales bacterium]
MIKIIDTVIEIPELEKPLTLLHITDLHLTLRDKRDSDYVEELGVERSGYFRNAKAAFDSIEEFIIGNKPDYTIVTGDFLDFPSRRNCDLLYDFLNNTCKNYLYTPGNHECAYPNESQAVEFHEKYYSRLFPVSGDTPDFQLIDTGDLLLIGIDDSTNQISPPQLEKMKNILKMNKPSIIFMHIPIYVDSLIDDVVKVWKQPIVIGLPSSGSADKLEHKVDGEIASGLIPSEETREFCELIKREGSLVKAIVCGHVHFEHEDEFAEGKIQYITPICSEYDNNDATIRRISIVAKKERR